jgi:hypothetical protein
MKTKRATGVYVGDSNIELCENPLSDSQHVTCDRQTDGRTVMKQARFAIIYFERATKATDRVVHELCSWEVAL